MLKPETSLADVAHGRSRIAPPIVMRLRAAGVATVEHFMTMSERTATLLFNDDDDDRALRRWRGRIRQQLHHEGK